jgi:HSP20 family protein
MGTNGYNAPERRKSDALARRPELVETPVVPVADIYETSDAYVVKLDMPGARKESIKLCVEPRYISVRAAVGGYHAEQTNILMNEIGRKAYVREFNLGRGINHNDVQAQFEDGVLTITLPKTEESKPREIQINRLFDGFFHGGTQADGDLGLSHWTPAVDIAERDDEYLVKVELPGVEKEDVKITLESNILTIRGEKKAEKEETGKEYHRMERACGSFQRSFTLPTTVKGDRIDALYKDGILTIRLPKAEEAKSKQIEVKVK